MTRIIDICNDLIFKAKEDERIKEIKFIKAYKENFAQMPIEGITAVVNIDKIVFGETFAGEYAESYKKGQLVEVALKIDLYSDRSFSGEELSIFAVKVQQAIYGADENDVIESSSISAIRFDSDLKSIYREIIFNLSVCMSGDN